MKKVALITGGTRGIGLGIAECLAREGYDLSLCGLRDERSVADTLNALRELGHKVLYTPCDVGDASQRAELMAATQDRFGGLQVLVNNAGIAPAQRVDLLEASIDEFERILRTNLQGPHFLTQQVARWMIEQRKADSNSAAYIINISSVSATMASTTRGEYCISKAGIGMSTQLWALRLAEFEIPVFEVRPGVVLTDMTSAVKEKYDALIEEGLIPQNRWGDVMDTGRIVAALVRGDFDYSTGQVFLVDGGLSLPRL